MNLTTMIAMKNLNLNLNQNQSHNQSLSQSLNQSQSLSRSQHQMWKIANLITKLANLIKF